MRTALLSRLTVLTVHHCQLPKARAQLQFVQALCTNGVNGRLGECALPVTGRRDVCVERCVVDTDSVKLLVSYRSLGTAASNSPQSRLEASSISAEPGGRPQADLDPCNAICSAASPDRRSAAPQTMMAAPPQLDAIAESPLKGCALLGSPVFDDHEDNQFELFQARIDAADTAYELAVE